MKNVLLIVFFSISIVSFSQVVIPDNAQVDPKAELKVYSTDKGVLIPRLSVLDLYSINSPANGLWVYNTSDDKFYLYNGSNWQIMEQTPTDTVTNIRFEGEYFYDQIVDKLLYWNGNDWDTVGVTP